MSLIPEFSSPCDLAARVPGLVAEFLDLEANLHRRFREETISDIIVASFSSLPGNNVVVNLPQESKTGSDFDIAIVDPSSNECIQYRIQAKRLTPLKKQWAHGSYRELAHPYGSGRQASHLVRSAAHEGIPTIPLYAFYNPNEACQELRGTISGLELADGRAINKLVKTLVKSKPARPRLKRLSVIQHLFFPLSTLLCPPLNEGKSEPRQILSPSLSRAAVERMITERPPRDDEPTDLFRLISEESHIDSVDEERRVLDGVDIDQTKVAHSAKLPTWILRAIEHRNERRLFAKVQRPRIVLISE